MKGNTLVRVLPIGAARSLRERISLGCPGGRYTGDQRGQRWSRAKVEWEMSDKESCTRPMSVVKTIHAKDSEREVVP